jgi:predicted dehydrogenase
MEPKPISRREFLKDMGLVAGGALLASSPWFSAFAEESHTTGEKVKIAVLGPGSRGQYHMRLLAANPKAEIAAVCDDYQPSLDAALKIAPNAKTYTDYRKLLEDPTIQGVVIATPLDVHRRMAIDAFEAGKHVLVEKSITKTLEDTLAVYNKWKSTDRVFFVGQQRLFDPRYIKAIAMVDSGMFGPIERINAYWYRNNDWRRAVPSPELERKINWRLYREYSLGLMTELCCHQIQIGTWALKQIPNTVMGHGSIIHWKDGREVYDDVHVLYTFDDGRKMTYDSMIANKFYGSEEQILCNKGTVEPEKGKFYYESVPPASGMMQMINEAERAVFGAIPFAGPSWVPETANVNKGEYILGEKPKGDGTDLLSAAFVEACITGVQPPMLAEEGYYASTLSILGDQAIMEQRTLVYPDAYKIDYLNHRAPVIEG